MSNEAKVPPWSEWSDEQWCKSAEPEAYQDSNGIIWSRLQLPRREMGSTWRKARIDDYAVIAHERELRSEWEKSQAGEKLLPSQELRSECCGAPIVVANEGTWFKCRQCEQPVDAVPGQASEAKHPEWSEGTLRRMAAEENEAGYVNIGTPAAHPSGARQEGELPELGEFSAEDQDAAANLWQERVFCNIDDGDDGHDALHHSGEELQQIVTRREAQLLSALASNAEKSATISSLGQDLYAKVEECKALREAMNLALPIMEEDKDVAERSFLPEPSKDEEEILTRYADAINAARAAITGEGKTEGGGKS